MNLKRLAGAGLAAIDGHDRPTAVESGSDERPKVQQKLGKENGSYLSGRSIQN